MLGGIFQKRKKIQELRAPTLQDIKRFREVYGRHAEARHVETPACFERSIYKAISCQKELHAIDFRQEDVTDPQIIALAETLLDMPLVSSLDLRDNRITDDGAKALLEVLRLQIITAKTAPKTDPKTKKLVPPPPVPEFTRYVTNVNLKGNEISASVLDEMVQYTEILKREDKRLEIRAALGQIDRNIGGGVDEEDFKAVVKLLTGTEPNKKEVKQLMSQSSVSGDNLQNAIALENVLLAKCSSSPSKKAACPPWEALVQVRHANIGASPRGSRSPAAYFSGHQASPSMHHASPIDGGSNSQNSSTTYARPLPSQMGQATMATTASAATLPLPSAPSTSRSPVISTSPLTVGASMDSSSPPKKVDFGPPSSPPPPLPLPQSLGPEQRGSASSVGSSSAKPRDSIDCSVDPVLAGTASERSANSTTNASAATGPPVFTRQNSSDSHRGGSAPSPHVSSAVSPTKVRDEYTMDFSSWRDDDPFGEDADDLLASPVQATSTDAADEVESVRSQELLRSVGSRQSAGSSTRPAPVVGGHASGKASDASDVRGPGDLSSLAYNTQSERVLDCGRDGTQGRPTTTTNVQREVEPAVDDVEEEEVADAVVVDVMKDGKPRNVAVVRHTEFKRGLGLQDFPGDVPLRNLVALILSENGLRDLSLFKECRFPVATVLDLSRNALSKVSDEHLACFPKLQVLDLSNNRLKTISGLGKLFDMKALSLCHNELRNVINLEHLVQLQILRLRANAIAAPSALRLLSLNKMLAHLDVDENPMMETDDRQRRKVTVHLLNIIPTLRTLGSVPIACHVTKDKRKLTAIGARMGKSLLEHDECPNLRSLWASNACDILQIVQDRDQPPPRSSYDEEDPFGDAAAGGYSPTRQKKPSRDAQRQKDELRSRFVGHRSRGKAPPSPAKAKASPFAFGPPLPPPQRKSPKKKALVDAKLAKEQLRRASQLSAPKHPPVDTDQLKQEQRRKSRPTFDVNMSVAERLQLVRDKSARRTSTLAPHVDAANGHHHRQGKRESEHVPALVMEIREPSFATHHSLTRSHQPVLEFRVEPLPRDSPRRVPLESNNQQHHSAPSPPPVKPITAAMPAPCLPPAERKPGSKETLFLQSLAVADFLSHAEEEISTALTALNVLLSMCERSPSDPRKLLEYRNSLDALDILDEQESHALFEKARHHEDPERARACTDEFEKLRMVKRCIKELLQKLETRAPDSPAIQSYCAELRASELRHLIDSRADDREATEESPPTRHMVQQPALETAEAQPLASLHATARTTVNEPGQTFPEAVQAHSEEPPPTTLHARLFADLSSQPNGTESAMELTDRILQETAVAPRDDDGGGEFDFLSSDTSMFDDIDVTDAAPRQQQVVETEEVHEERIVAEDKLLCEDDESLVETAVEVDEKELLDETISTAPPVFASEQNERSPSATTVDITQDFQHDDEDFDFDSELPLEEDATSPASQQAVDAAEADDVFSSSNEHNVESGAELDWDTQGTTGEGGEEDSVEASTVDVELATTAGEADEIEFDMPGEDTDISADADEHEQERDGEEQVAGADDEDDEEAETFGDWEKGFDPVTNHYFWFNHETGESQWVPPEGWPYDVDTPFEEDAQVQEEQEEEQVAVEDDSGDGDYVTTEVADEHESTQPESPVKSSFEADDDVFSDQDLPDF